jgi:hypothetical protein
LLLRIGPTIISSLPGTAVSTCRLELVGKFEFVVKGHDFIRAAKAQKIEAGFSP